MMADSTPLHNDDCDEDLDEYSDDRIVAEQYVAEHGAIEAKESE